MSTLTLIGLLLLGAPWIVTLAVVAFLVVVWWTQPRQRTPATPVLQSFKLVTIQPVPNVCLDCGRVQGPSLTTCWFCSGGKSRLRPVDPSEAEMYV